MILKNATIVDENFKLRRCDLEMESDSIVRIGEHLDGEDALDLTGKYILPGFIDTHIHGAYGIRISDEAPNLHQITRFEATQGVTAIAITTASSMFEDLLKQIDTAFEASKKTVGAKIAGIHCEGPFLSKAYKGAMNPDFLLTPDTKKFMQMLERSRGLLKIMTIAPETEHALDLIKLAVQSGVTVSMGHTNATYDEAERAIATGASQQTHVFNASRPFNHREPGVLGASLTNPKVCCEMICDYIHLHPAAVRTVYALKGPEKINIISDSGPATGINITEFEADGLTRYVKDGVIRLADGTIAGSAKTVLEGVQNLLGSGIPLESVSKMASLNPAKSLKIADKTGSLAVGKLADIVVLDADYHVNYTFINGRCEYQDGK